MKAKRLILEADSSTESKAAASQGRPTLELEAKMNMVRKKDASAEKNLRTSEAPSSVSDDTEEDLVALDKVAKRAVEDVGGEAFAPQKGRNDITTTKAKYNVLQKRLAEEVEKRRYSEETCEDLWEDTENAKCAIVDLRNKLEASRTAYNAKLQRVDELRVALEKKEQKHAAELGAKMKDLAECEAAMTLWQSVNHTLLAS
ncbi:hypothetical protein AXG93_4703s1010 [Marchantia polymorpha subsp. ruderalis]|uniref:Uncharacterized protein n=1 Tax=Marchantia polymorpha subsp. ruderalis TaxID=1480154 RepID=A0A176VR90_MARPO|nr:hypothetical protein AXG93_4703s1010 [Marchantia polymorpha subsp. ruderalis]